MPWKGTRTRQTRRFAQLREPETSSISLCLAFNKLAKPQQFCCTGRVMVGNFNNNCKQVLQFTLCNAQPCVAVCVAVCHTMRVSSHMCFYTLCQTFVHLCHNLCVHMCHIHAFACASPHPHRHRHRHRHPHLHTLHF